MEPTGTNQYLGILGLTLLLEKFDIHPTVSSKEWKEAEDVYLECEYGCGDTLENCTCLNPDRFNEDYCKDDFYKENS